VSAFLVATLGLLASSSRVGSLVKSLYRHSPGGLSEAELRDVTLPPRLGSQQGQVVDRISQRPLSGVRVAASRSMWRSCETLTDAAGLYFLDSLPCIRGKVRISYSATGYETVNLTWPFELIESVGEDCRVKIVELSPIR
jgi:hypothetical protein